MDLDFVMQKPFERHVPNFLASEAVGRVGNSILGFSHDGDGHFVAKAIIR